MGLARTTEARAQAEAGPTMPIQPIVSSSISLPNGFSSSLSALDEPMSLDEPTSPVSPTRPRPGAEKEVFLRASDKTPIWSTHYLDPCLRTSLINVPHHVTNAANIALTGLSSGPKTTYNQTIGAPVDGLAKAARDWIVPADARFVSETGGIEVGVAVVDGGGDAWGREKGRKRARVEASSKQGGIKIDIVRSKHLNVADGRLNWMLIGKSTCASRRKPAMCCSSCMYPRAPRAVLTFPDPTPSTVRSTSLPLPIPHSTFPSSQPSLNHLQIHTQPSTPLSSLLCKPKIHHLVNGHSSTVPSPIYRNTRRHHAESRAICSIK